MSERLPWIVVALLGAALLWTHISHGQRIEQLSRTLSGTEASSLTAEAGSDDRPALLARVKLLETQIAEMTQRRGQRQGPRAVAGNTSRQPAGSAGGGSAAMAAAIPQVDSGDLVLEVLESDDPEVRDRLREVIDDELSTRREDRREERRERRKAQAEQMVRDLGNDYHISDSQQQTLRELLSDEQEQIGQFFQAARQDHSWGEARDKAQDLREDNDAEAMDLLNEEAYAGWQSKRDAEIARHYGRQR